MTRLTVISGEHSSATPSPIEGFVHRLQQGPTMIPVDDAARPAQGHCVQVPPDEAAIAAGLCELIDAGDAAGAVAALGELARRRGMSQLARDTGLSREALYRALRADSYPRFDTIVRVCAALGLKLRAHPVDVGG